MKAVRFFFGYDSYGRSVERALSETGKWFSRAKVETRYGLNWSKWTETEAPKFETHGTSAYTGEKFEYPFPCIFWGFNRMDELDEIPRVRLPG